MGPARSLSAGVALLSCLCFNAAVDAAPTDPSPPPPPGGGPPPPPGRPGDDTVVDLSYALYRPVSFNQTGQYYNFSNIRYAAPPIGDLRFADPQPPVQQDRNKIIDGKEGFICPQGLPAFSAGGGSTGLSPVATGLSGLPESEDCLFLDVMVPQKQFQNRKPAQQANYRRWDTDKPKLAPVLFNIFGGGFWSGEKAGFYDPRGLLERSHGDYIYVSINYRLGAFGFLSNLEESASNSTSPNAGLLDQRMALKWVQKYIEFFGGDKNNVTIIGESAGGVSVTSHIVAYGGAKPEENKLFAQAIAQSAGVEPVYAEQAAIGANLFLAAAKVTSADEARKASTEVLQAANKKAVAATPFLVTQFGPGVDGDLLPDLHLRLLNSGRFNKDLHLVVSHNSRETGVSVAGVNTNDTTIRKYLDLNLPEATSDIKDYLLNVLYPPPLDGVTGSLPGAQPGGLPQGGLPGNIIPYTSQLERQQILRAESTLSCPSYHLAKAYGGKSHNYIFSIPPAIHAQDLAYTYYPTTPTLGFYPNRAVQLQQYLSSFVTTGDPNTGDLLKWPTWGDDGNPMKGNAVNITIDGLDLVEDNVNNVRCEWWNKALYRK